MAATYAQTIRDNVIAQKNAYISNFFVDAESELNALGLPANVYFRDLYFDIGSGKIMEISTNNIVSTLTLEMQFLYQPQGVQLYVLALNSNYYPI